MTLQGLLSRLRKAFRLRRQVVLRMVRPAASVEPAANVDSLEIRRITEGDLPAVLEVGHIGEAIMRRRLARGDWGYLATVDGKPAGFGWVQFTGEHEVTQAGRAIAIAPGGNMFYNARVNERARSRKVYSAMLATTVREVHATGARELRAYVNEDNAASLRGLERAGFTVEGRWVAWHVSVRVIPTGRD